MKQRQLFALDSAVVYSHTKFLALMEASLLMQCINTYNYSKIILIKSTYYD